MMDAKRFDSLARSLASWTSRRKLLGTAAGVASGAAVWRNANAQNSDGEPPAECPALGTIKNSDVLSIIAGKSSTLLTQLNALVPTPPATPVANPSNPYPKPHWNNEIQAYEFVTEMKCLVAEGTNANNWNDADLSNYIHRVRGVMTGFTLGFSGCLFAEAGSSAEPDGVRALLATKKSEICGHSGCFRDALDQMFTCLKDCVGPDIDDCAGPCFLDFVTRIVVGTPAVPASEGTPAVPAVKPCLPDMIALCSGDCCLGTCWCNGC